MDNIEVLKELSSILMDKQWATEEQYNACIAGADALEAQKKAGDMLPEKECCGKSYYKEKCKNCPYIKECHIYTYNKSIDLCTSILAKAIQERDKLKDLVYLYLGGEDDGYGNKTSPITYKEAYEDDVRYDTWSHREMKKACEKIKAHPKWNYKKDAYPSPSERAIVAGCSQAVEQLQAKLDRVDNNKVLNIIEDSVAALIKKENKGLMDINTRITFLHIATAICNFIRKE